MHATFVHASRAGTYSQVVRLSLRNIFGGKGRAEVLRDEHFFISPENNGNKVYCFLYLLFGTLEL